MTEGIVTPIASSPSSTARGSGGRTIGYGEFGDPNGKPVVLFHGFGDSRLTRFPDDELTARLGIRLITFDRPGIGLTDPMKELTILDRTDDVIDLVNSLGLNNISLLGWSGGAPYALAAAGCMAGKVKRAAIVSGFGPFERPGFKKLAPREIKRVMTILKVAPWMANVMATESQKGLQGDASAAMEMSRGLGGSADSGVLNMGGVRANVTSGAEEAFRQGPAGVANDMLLLFRFKWGFNPEDVHTPIDLWYGGDDHMTPPDVGRGLASILPQPRLRMVPGAGHLLYLRNWEEILRALVADEAPATTTTFQAVAPVAPLSPVTETLAAASLGEATPIAEPDHAQPAAEPEKANGDVLGSTPAWSWTQPAVAAQPAVQTPAEEPAEREPVAYQEEPVAPLDKPAFTPGERVASASGDQLARLRALGFIVDVPEPLVVLAAALPEAAEPAAVDLEAADAEAVATELDAVAAETAGVAEEAEVAEAAEVAEEAEVVEAAEVAEEPEVAEEAEVVEEPQALSVSPELSEVDPEVSAEPEPEAAPAQPEAEAAPAEPEADRSELKLVEPEAAPQRPSLTWQPMQVPGLLIDKPRQEAAAAEPQEAPVEHETVAEPDVAPVDAEVELPGEPEPAAMAPGASPASAGSDETEAQRLRAAGFVVSAPEAPAEAEAPVAEVAQGEEAEARRVRVAEDELARLRAAGFAMAEPKHDVPPAEASPEPEFAAVEAEAVEPAAVEPESTEPEAREETAGAPEMVEAETATVDGQPVVAEAEAVTTDADEAPGEAEPEAELERASAEGEPIVTEAEAVTTDVDAPTEVQAVADAEPAVADSAPVVAKTETVLAEIEAAPIEQQPAAEIEAESAPGGPEPIAAEAVTEPAIVADQDIAGAEEERARAATELEEEASEAVVVAPLENATADRLAEAGFAGPHSEPTPAIAASAEDAPIMKAAARAQAPAEVGAEQAAETGVGWVETVPMDVEAAAAAASAQQTEPDSPPEPMEAGVEDEPAAQAPARDETMERLRAAGFLIGEPRGR